MSLRLRFALGAILGVVVGLSWLLYFVRSEVRPRYKASIEESLVEISQLAASAISVSGDGPEIDVEKLDRLFSDLHSRRFKARVFEMNKEKVDFKAYVTDRAGRVVFDTHEPSQVGQDFSRWNDVYKTLRGEYGARSTHQNPQDKLSSELFVAAPIVRAGQTIGVVSVSRSEKALAAFIDKAQRQLLLAGLLSGCAIALIVALLSVAITKPINRLVAYANANRGEGRVPLPKLSIPEFRRLGEAFEEMRLALEGKKAVEFYVQSLTHELKSPLSSIRGAAELAQEPQMPSEDRARFLKNIETESARIHEIIERLLLIVALESRQGLDKVEVMDVGEVCREVASHLEATARARNVRVQLKLSEGAKIRGEKFLIEQALRNLVQNAIEFSPNEGQVKVTVTQEGNEVRVEILDEGLGIPDFAQPRVFEKFYSLERPSTGKKGTGLGLSFVREAIALHGGRVDLRNRPDRSGAVAVAAFVI